MSDTSRSLLSVPFSSRSKKLNLTFSKSSNTNTFSANANILSSRPVNIPNVLRTCDLFGSDNVYIGIWEYLSSSLSSRSAVCKNNLFTQLRCVLISSILELLLSSFFSDASKLFVTGVNLPEFPVLCGKKGVCEFLFHTFKRRKIGKPHVYKPHHA